MIPRQTALWTRMNVHPESEPPSAAQRKKSEKRQRTKRVTVRLLPSEKHLLTDTAHRLQISVAELVRRSALDHMDEVEQSLVNRRRNTP